MVVRFRFLFIDFLAARREAEMEPGFRVRIPPFKKLQQFGAVTGTAWTGFPVGDE
jgi:hypothetical protein